MADETDQNHNEQSSETPAEATTPVAETVAHEEAPASSETPADAPLSDPVTENHQSEPAPEPVVAAPPVVDTVVLAQPAAPAPVVTKSATDLDETDDEHVAALKIQLSAFAKAIMRPGTKPEDFKSAAKLAVQFTNYVVQYPKVPVLNTLLKFFEENNEGVCASTNYSKGLTTMSQSDQQRVSYLYSLFSGLANKLVVRINNAQVINILKKPEIADFYNRKMAGIRQAANVEG